VTVVTLRASRLQIRPEPVDIRLSRTGQAEKGAVMRRYFLVAGLVVALGAVLGIAPAGAGAGNDVSVTLSCDRGVSATVAATLVAEAPGAVSDLSCGADAKNVRVVVAMPAAATAIVVTQFDVTSTDTVSCADATPIPVPARVDCGPKFGAKLVVR
jgi:hypothetical protein